ncbi:hypothetical protein DFH06DRAFT_1224287 [Mycena polygramma]|nr:hypothetical protein DFH06DRAFT_1224287 [Mycena polygramma]
MPLTLYSTSLASAACLLLTAATLVVWQKSCKCEPTWIKELHALGRPRKHKFPGTAVICGGSIAGIVTARICADHFQRVVVVDPEIEDPEKPKTRIMQYNASHAFLTLFVNGARRLWPTFDAEVKAAGGRIVPADVQIHYAGALLPTPFGDYAPGQFPDTLVIRRAVGQTVLHRLLLKHPTAANITPLTGTVRGVNLTSDRASIESAVVRLSDGKQISVNDVAMIADCTGGAQSGLKWLNAAGFPLPDNLRCHYNGNLCYLTLCFDVPPDLASELPIPEALKKTAFVYASGSPIDDLSWLIALAITDNNTMQFLIGNTAYEDLPRTSRQVTPFLKASKLPIPSWVLDVLDILCERTEPSFDTIRLPAQSYVRYDTAPAKALPCNFIAVGDANMNLNPVYGQGFAKCIMNGIALNSLLHAIDTKSIPSAVPGDFSARYFKKSASAVQGLWDSTRFHDYGSPSCEPMEGTGTFVRWFEHKLVTAVMEDKEVASTFWHVRHLLAAERAFLAPTVLWKILRTPSRF